MDPKRTRRWLGLVIVVTCGLGVWGVMERVASTQGKPPLSLADVLGYLSYGTESLAAKNRDLTESAGKRKVTFPLTPEIKQELLRSGASEGLIAAIRDNSPPVPKPTPCPVCPPCLPPVMACSASVSGERLRPVGAMLPAESYRCYAIETPTLNRSGKVIKTTKGEARSYVETLPGGVTLEMVQVAGGSFKMGSPPDEALRDDDETQHDVTMPAFFMGRYEVTQAQWEAVRKLPKVTIELPPNPSSFKGDDSLPVDSVTWNEAKEFCARLSKYTGRQYRLPAEAQWEYAARAGTTTPFAFGATITPDIVNYDSNYPYADVAKDEKSYRRKTFSAFAGKCNTFGMCSLHGNLWEWCEDEYKNYKDTPTDGSAAGFTEKIDTAGGVRVVRGGSWGTDARYCRSAYRFRYDPASRYALFGFRVAAASR